MALLKGAFIRYDDDTAGVLPVVVVFQFNPETISRKPSLPTLRSTTPATRTQARNVVSDPEESMSFDLNIDATDQLAAGSPLAATSGILPTLSALEMLLLPAVPLNLARMSGHASHTTPPKFVPLVLFFWGPFRIVPVRIKTISIDETLFDTRLNPVRAKVHVDFDVLTPHLLGENETFAREVYEYAKGVKQVMAALNTLNAIEVGAGASLSLSI